MTEKFKVGIINVFLLLLLLLLKWRPSVKFVFIIFRAFCEKGRQLCRSATQKLNFISGCGIKNTMASNSDEGSRGNDDSSEEESLATLKRKAYDNYELNDADDNDKRQRMDVESDEGPHPGIFVKVEVEELNYQDDDEAASRDVESPDPEPIKRRTRPSREKIDPDYVSDWRPPKRKKNTSCPDCGKVFENATEMKKHSIEHQVQTRHKCEVCGRCFSKAFGLKTHKRMHGEKNEHCPICDASFTLAINLGRHMMYHHKRMKCEHCDAFYETKEQLYEHKVAVHPEHPTIPPDVPRKPRSWSTYKIKETTEETPEKRIRSKNDTKATDGDTDDSTDDVDQEDTDNLDEGNNFDVYTKKEDVAYQIQCAIVSKMHKGRSVTDICQIYNLTPEVINEIWEDRDEFVILKRAGRRSIKYMNSVLDRKILDWLNYQKQNDVQVTGKMLMDIAESFAKENGFVAFNGSKKWLDRFKTRYKITFRSTVRRKRVFSSIPNESKWKRQFLEEQWLDARNGFNDEDIYTGDEVGVYYNSSRGRIKKMAGKKYIHGFPKDRLSIFMCTNVTGSDKKKLLVCGTEDPLVHSYRSPDTLPVTYIRHGQGHFTTPMFEEYVKFWNRELQLQSRKAVLILDRATIHSKLTLSHLKLVFVPWKAANTLMPIKNGIFNKFRDEYRRLLVQEKAMNAIRGVDRNLTSLEALNILEKAWDRTPSEAIANCFAATGYDVKNDYVHKHVPVPTVTEDDEVALCRMLSDFDVDTYFHDSQSLDNYITVDDEFLTGHGSNGSVFGGNHKAVDPVTQRKEIEEILPLATERPETDEVECQVTKSRALEDVEIVRRYLQANVTQYDVFTKFMDVERFVLKSTVNF